MPWFDSSFGVGVGVRVDDGCGTCGDKLRIVITKSRVTLHIVWQAEEHSQ